MQTQAGTTTSHGDRIQRVGALVKLRRDSVRWREHSDRELRSLVHAGELVRILQGAYLPSADWKGMFPEDRALVRALAAAQLNTGRDWIFCAESAAALWGLPMYGLQDLRVHIATAENTQGRTSRLVRRHLLDLSPDEVVTIEGIRVTSLERTMLDLGHTASAELALSAADAGLRKLWGSGRDLSEEVIAQWRARQLELLRGSRRPGVRDARELVARVDPRADSPMESVSRLQLERLRVPYQAQVPVELGGGRTVWMDFEFPGQAAFGEVDGLSKYTAAELRGDRTVEQVVINEKLREDEVRGRTGKRVVRWTSNHLTSTRAFGQRLREFGIKVPGY